MKTGIVGKGGREGEKEVMSGATKGIHLEKRGSENLRIKWLKNIGAVEERDAISITLSLLSFAVCCCL
jgi:hypothetical protein